MKKILIVALIVMSFAGSVSAKGNQECVYTQQLKALESVSDSRGTTAATMLKYDKSLFVYKWDFKQKTQTMLWAIDLMPVGNDKAIPFTVLHSSNDLLVLKQGTSDITLAFLEDKSIYRETNLGLSTGNTARMNWNEGVYWKDTCEITNKEPNK